MEDYTILNSKLQYSKSRNIKYVQENDIDKIENIKIDKNLSKMERILDFIENTKNPYIFCIDGIKVKFEYSDNGIRLSECINNLIINKFE